MSDNKRTGGQVSAVVQIALESDSDDDQVFEPAPAYQDASLAGPDEKQENRTVVKEEKSPVISDKDTSSASDNPSKNKVNTSAKLSLTLDEACDLAAKKTICALGPRTSFFYWNGEPSISWTYLYRDSECPYTVSGESLKKWMIKEPHHVALSPHGAGYFAYTSYTDGLVWRFLDVSPLTRPKKRKPRKLFDKMVAAYTLLKEWLQKEVITSQDIKLTQVAFGPAARYLAWKPNGSYISNDLPAGFQGLLEKRKLAKNEAVLPQRVTFGLGEAWAAIWDDGTYHLFTDNKYPQAERSKLELHESQLKYVALGNDDSKPEHLLLYAQGGNRYRMKPSRLEVVQKQWDKQLLHWSQDLDTTISAFSISGKECSRKTITPKDAVAAEAALSAQEAKKSEQLAQNAALLSIQSSKKSMTASKVAVGAGVLAIATGCSVM